MPPLGHFQLKPGRVALLPQPGHPGRPGRSIVKRHALTESFQRLLANRALDSGAIHFRDPEPGMGEPVSEFAVIGEQQKPLAVPVQPAHRVHSFLHIAYQFNDGRAMLRVMNRRQEAFGLVQQ
jgi:hypothetical protein